jgi:hypothetical protein
MIEKFAVIGTPSLEALLLHAEPGTHSAEALAKLAASTAESAPAISTAER